MYCSPVWGTSNTLFKQRARSLFLLQVFPLTPTKFQLSIMTKHIFIDATAGANKGSRIRNNNIDSNTAAAERLRTRPRLRRERRIPSSSLRSARGQVRDAEPRGTVGIPDIQGPSLWLPTFEGWALHRRLQVPWQVVETAADSRRDVALAQEVAAYTDAATKALIHQIETSYQIPEDFVSARFSCRDEIEAMLIAEMQSFLVMGSFDDPDAGNAVLEYHRLAPRLNYGIID